MEMVLLTALGVGGATVLGSAIGFFFKKLSHKFSDIILSFAAGIMLAAAVFGLILPSVEYGGKFGLLITVSGIFAGALALNLIDKMVPHLHKIVGADIEEHKGNANISKVLLLPESSLPPLLPPPAGALPAGASAAGASAGASVSGAGAGPRNTSVALFRISPALSFRLSRPDFSGFSATMLASLSIAWMAFLNSSA